jgi:hypothetical protein
MTCPAQVFRSVTRDQFARIVQKAAAAGVVLDGHAGEVTHAAFALKWRFEPATGVFTVQCTRRPFIVSCSTINGRINELMDLCRLGEPVTIDY